MSYIHVEVLFFGILRQKLGLKRQELELAAGVTVGELMVELGHRYGLEELGAGTLRVAVNREYVDSAAVLTDNAEVAIIPPVSGGCRVRNFR